jgi:hypothetical protein
MSQQPTLWRATLASLPHEIALPRSSARRSVADELGAACR